MIDTHCHLDFYKDEELDEIINSSEFFNISKIINPGTSFDRVERAISISHKYDKVFFAVGLHPEEVGNTNAIEDGELKMEDKNANTNNLQSSIFNLQLSIPNFENIITKFREFIIDEKCVAVGEIGLDYYYIKDSPDFESIKLQQKELFKKQLDLAQEFNKPVIIHTRNAGQDVLDILENYDLKFVIHCFSEDLDFAKRVVATGNKISFTGLITFKNADPKILEVVSYIPNENFMVETDGPFLTPQQFRGKQNKPEYTGFVAEKIAEVKGISLKDIEDITDRNAGEFFGI